MSLIFHFRTNITYDNNHNIMKTKFINDTNQLQYEARKNPDHRRQEDSDLIDDYINNTNWENESNYFNSVRINKRNMRSRTIKMNNKEWLKSKDGIETLKRNSNG